MKMKIYKNDAAGQKLKKTVSKTRGKTAPTSNKKEEPPKEKK